MKARHIALALLLAAVPCLHAGPEGEPSGGEPHLYYSNGYYFTDPEQHNVYTGDYRECYPNGTLRLEVSIKNGTPEGTYVIYFDNRRPHEVRSYRDGKLHGTWRTYDRSGQLLSEAEYRNGKKHGTWRIWDELGTQRYEMNYEDGRKTGIWRMWDEKGDLIEEKKY